MEIRKIKPEEAVTSSLVSTIVFLGQESEDYRLRLQEPLAHSEGYERIWGAFDDNGKMCSSMHVHDFTIRYDGHDVGMGGVGGVATLPECRKGGYIRKIFESCLPEMLESGKVFSFLYPFSFKFYRKFGYEICYTPNKVRVPVSFFQSYPYPDNIELFIPGGHTRDFAEVYETFSRGLNLACARDEAAWERMLEKDPFITRHYAYLHKDENGNPDAYLMFKTDEGHGDDGNSINVKELAWATPGALHAMFGFIGGLSPQFESFRWNAPRNVNLFSLFPESYEINAQLPANGMNRVVNVQKAFELMKAPKINGSAVIGVNDAFLPQNTGVYALEWENGVMRRVKRADKPADLEIDVETLAQLTTGWLNMDEARYKRGVAVHGNDSVLNDLFVHKNLYIMEHF